MSKLFLAGLAAAVGLTASTAEAGTSGMFGLMTAASSESDLTVGGCKSETQQIANCAVQFSVCYGFYKRKWKYTATACASGVCGSSPDHYDSATGAAEAAAKALFAMGPSCAFGLEAHQYTPIITNAVGIMIPAVETSSSQEVVTLTSGGCKSETQQIATCSVQFSVCYGFYKLKWKYTATACASGICGSSPGHYDSGKGAAEAAAQALFAMVPACAIPPQVQGAEAVAAPPALKADESVTLVKADEEIPMLGGITCKKVTEQIGPCSVQFEVCGEISKLKWKYHAKACASGICRSGGTFSSGKGAAEDAAKQLFAVPPACALPPQ